MGEDWNNRTNCVLYQYRTQFYMIELNSGGVYCSDFPFLTRVALVFSHRVKPVSTFFLVYSCKLQRDLQKYYEDILSNQ